MNKREGLERPYTIAMIAHALAGGREQRLATDMADDVSKPVQPEALIAVLKKCQPVLLSNQVSVMAAE